MDDIPANFKGGESSNLQMSADTSQNQLNVETISDQTFGQSKKHKYVLPHYLTYFYLFKLCFMRCMKSITKVCYRPKKVKGNQI